MTKAEWIAENEQYENDRTELCKSLPNLSHEDLEIIAGMTQEELTEALLLGAINDKTN